MNKENQQNLANRSFSEDESPNKSGRAGVHVSPSPTKLARASVHVSPSPTKSAIASVHVSPSPTKSALTSVHVSPSPTKLARASVHVSPSPTKLSNTSKQSLQSLIKGIEIAFLKQKSRMVSNVIGKDSSSNTGRDSSDKNDVNNNHDSNLESGSGGVKENGYGKEETNIVTDRTTVSLENTEINNENKKKELVFEQNGNSTTLNKSTDLNEEKSKHSAEDANISEGQQEKNPDAFSLRELIRHAENDSNTKCEETFYGHTYKIKTLTLPNVHAGSTYLSDVDSQLVKLSIDVPKPIKYTDQEYLKISNPRLMSGGTVIFGDLAEHVVISSQSVDTPLVINNDVNDIEISQISPMETVSRNCETSLKLWSGGHCDDGVSWKASLPAMFPSNTFLYEQRKCALFQGSPSGGRLVQDESPYSVTLRDLF